MAQRIEQNQTQFNRSTAEAPNQVRVASGLNVLLGLWMIASPWIFAYSLMTGALWSSVIVGVVVAILALIRFSMPAKPLP